MDILGDPDSLCAMAFSFHDINPDARRNSSSADEVLKNGELKRGAILDALARLIVFKATHQIAAVGAVLDSHGHIELYLAGNSEVPPKITQHLKDILERIISIRDAIDTSPDRTAILECITQNPLVIDDTRYPALALLSELQRVLLEYSRDRIRARLLKGTWDKKISHLVSCVNGDPAKGRFDLSEGERKALERIQQSSDMREIFAEFSSSISPVLKSLAEGADTDIKSLRRACVLIAMMNGAFKDDMVYFNRFITAYVVRTRREMPRKPIDIVKWLNKVAFVVIEYQVLVKIITQPTLSALFGSYVPVHTVPNTLETKPQPTELTTENIKATFATLGYTPETFVAGSPDEFEKLVEGVETAARKTIVKHVHCECALLCHLDKLGQAMMPYIGVSKLSCAFCDLFFAAYREYKGVVYTHGTHGQTGPWKYPDFPNDANTKATFCQKLLEYIRIRIRDERELRKASKHSQSTVSSKVDDEGFVVSKWRSAAQVMGNRTETMN